MNDNCPLFIDKIWLFVPIDNKFSYCNRFVNVIWFCNIELYVLSDVINVFNVKG